MNIIRKTTEALVGERTTRVFAAGCNWLIGIPVKSGGEISLEVAKDAVLTMEKTVLKLTDAVAKVSASYDKAKDIFNAKQQEGLDYENQAQLAKKSGNLEAAKLAIHKCITIEKMLPPLKQNVETAEKFMISAKETLQKERKKLEVYKLELNNLVTKRQFEVAIGEILDATIDLDIGAAKGQFFDAKIALDGSMYHGLAKAELMSDNPTEKIESELQSLTDEDEITRRLASF